MREPVPPVQIIAFVGEEAAAVWFCSHVPAKGEIVVWYDQRVVPSIRLELKVIHRETIRYAASNGYTVVELHCKLISKR